MKTTLRWIESHHIKQKTLYMHTHYKRKHQHNHSSSTHTFIHSFIHSVIWFGIASFISCSLPILSPIQLNFFSFFSPRQVIALCVFFSHYLSLFLFISLYFLFSSLGIVHAILQSILWVVMPNVCSIKSFFRCTWAILAYRHQPLIQQWNQPNY